MTKTGWKIALAASVALNVFGLAGAGAAWVAHEKDLARNAAMPPPSGGQPSFTEIMDGLDPAVRERVRSTLRASAKAAKPDFQQAREVRLRAIALAASPTGDVAEIARLLDESRAAEIRGRQRMEQGAVPVFATLGPSDRQALSVILKRRGGHRDGPPAKPVGPEPAVSPASPEPVSPPARP